MTEPHSDLNELIGNTKWANYAENTQRQLRAERRGDVRLSWQYGIYRTMFNSFGIARDSGCWGGRVTGLVVDEDDGRRLVHLGVGTYNGETVQGERRVRARPLLRNGPGYAVPVLVD